MHSLVVSFAVFLLVFIGAIVGMRLRRVLPMEHLGTDSKETMRLAIGLVVTLTSLVLGMLVSSGKTYYEGQKNVVAQMSSDIILLDNLLASFGPESKDLRVELRRALEDSINRIWPEEGSHLSELKPRDFSRNINAQVAVLVPKDATEASVKAQIVATVQSLKKTYWLMFLNSEQTSVSIPLLVVLTFWLVMIFISFGVFAPPNSTVISTLVMCALAVSAAIYIIMDLYSPFNGTMKISAVALREALSQMAIDR